MKAKVGNFLDGTRLEKTETKTTVLVGNSVDGKTHKKTKKNSSALAIPMIYCTRRLVLAFSLVYLQDYFWIQIFIQILLVQTSLFAI